MGIVSSSEEISPGGLYRINMTEKLDIVPPMDTSNEFIRVTLHNTFFPIPFMIIQNPSKIFKIDGSVVDNVSYDPMIPTYVFFDTLRCSKEVQNIRELSKNKLDDDDETLLTNTLRQFVYYFETIFNPISHKISDVTFDTINGTIVPVDWYLQINPCKSKVCALPSVPDPTSSTGSESSILLIIFIVIIILAFMYFITRPHPISKFPNDIVDYQLLNLSSKT